MPLEKRTGIVQKYSEAETKRRQDAGYQNVKPGQAVTPPKANKDD